METPPSTVLRRLTSAYGSRRDPARAEQMSAYLRHQFPFLGIPSPVRAALDRQITAGLPPLGQRDLVEVTGACWDRAEREYQYFAVAQLRRHVRRCTPDLLPHVQTLITSKSWWDTVDALATHVVGGLVSAHASLRAVMDTWIESDNIWLARAAILHQERWKDRTDPGLLFAYCLRRAAEDEFFIRKAIGWALRSYARVDPDAVASFVQAHGDRLSGLSKREALRHIGTQGAPLTPRVPPLPAP